MQIEAMQNELTAMLCRVSFKYSDKPVFKLVSGRLSHYYVNCKPTTLSARGMYLVGHLMFDRIRSLQPQAVGGLTFGADPIAVATAFASELAKQPFNAFSIRKTQKDHGIVKWVEGDVQPGQKVVIIDDVATTGGSTVKAILRAREEGLHIAGAVVLVDRQEGGLENIAQHVPTASALVTTADLRQFGQTHRHASSPPARI